MLDDGGVEVEAAIPSACSGKIEAFLGLQPASKINRIAVTNNTWRDRKRFLRHWDISGNYTPRAMFYYSPLQPPFQVEVLLHSL